MEKTRRELDLEMVRDAEKIEENLSEWEMTFIDSVSKQMDREGATLTDPQRTKLEQILREKE